MNLLDDTCLRTCKRTLLPPLTNFIYLGKVLTSRRLLMRFPRFYGNVFFCYRGEIAERYVREIYENRLIG